MAPSHARGEAIVFATRTAFRDFVSAFCLVVSAFDIYAIVVGFRWLHDFEELSGRNSTNWGWTVAIIVLAFLSLFGGVLTWSISRRLDVDDGKESSSWSMGGLGISSACRLAYTVPIWDAVRKYHWADVLRAAGHADHADHVDVYVRMQTVVISILAFIISAYVLIKVAVLLTVSLKKNTDVTEINTERGTGQNGAGQDGAGQDGAGQNGAGQNGAREPTGTNANAQRAGGPLGSNPLSPVCE